VTVSSNPVNGSDEKFDTVFHSLSQMMVTKRTAVEAWNEPDSDAKNFSHIFVEPGTPIHCTRSAFESVEGNMTRYWFMINQQSNLGGGLWVCEEDVELLPEEPAPKRFAPFARMEWLTSDSDDLTASSGSARRKLPSGKSRIASAGKKLLKLDGSSDSELAILGFQGSAVRNSNSKTDRSVSSRSSGFDLEAASDSVLSESAEIRSRKSVESITAQLSLLESPSKKVIKHQKQRLRNSILTPIIDMTLSASESVFGSDDEPLMKSDSAGKLPLDVAGKLNSRDVHETALSTVDALPRSASGSRRIEIASPAPDLKGGADVVDSPLSEPYVFPKIRDSLFAESEEPPPALVAIPPVGLRPLLTKEHLDSLQLGEYLVPVTRGDYAAVSDLFDKWSTQVASLKKSKTEWQKEIQRLVVFLRFSDSEMGVNGITMLGKSGKPLLLGHVFPEYTWHAFASQINDSNLAFGVLKKRLMIVCARILQHGATANKQVAFCSIMREFMQQPSIQNIVHQFGLEGGSVVDVCAGLVNRLGIIPTAFSADAFQEILMTSIVLLTGLFGDVPSSKTKYTASWLADRVDLTGKLREFSHKTGSWEPVGLDWPQRIALSLDALAELHLLVTVAACTKLEELEGKIFAKATRFLLSLVFVFEATDPGWRHLKDGVGSSFTLEVLEVEPVGPILAVEMPGSKKGRGPKAFGGRAAKKPKVEPTGLKDVKAKKSAGGSKKKGKLDAGEILAANAASPKPPASD